MELWIRGQKRNLLIKVQELCVNSNDYGDKWFVINYFGESKTYLGTYKTEERALQILDEIQNILQPKILLKEPKIDVKNDENLMQTLTGNIYIQTTQQVEYELKQAGQFVYTMPEE